MTPVGLTSRWVAASRAYETERPNGLFQDPFARALAGEAGFAMHADCKQVRSGSGPQDGPDPYLAIRTRYLDDALLAAVEGGLTQVVVMAAGMDSRAFRLTWPAGTVLFEIDRDEIFDYKEEILTGLGAVPTCDRRIVRADLEHNWIDPLVDAGFDRSRPAAFLVEGLVVYLDDAAVAGLLTSVASIAQPGSWIAADVPGVELLTSSFMKPFADKLASLGCPWLFGVANPEEYFAQFGWNVAAVMPGEPSAHYGLWPYPTPPRWVPGIPRSYFVVGKLAQEGIA